MNQPNKTLLTSVSKVLLAGSFAIAFSTPVSAQNWYAGASAGQATAKDVACDLDITCSLDDSDTGYKLFGGYNFSKNLAVEFGYADLGEISASGTDTGLGTASLNIETTAIFVTVNGIFPVSQNVNLFAKAGMARWDMDLSATSSVLGSASLSDDGFDILFGVGASFDVSKTVSIRAEWERFAVGDAETTGEGDIDLLTAGVTIMF